MNDALTIHRMLLTHEIQHEIVRLPRVISQADELADVLGLPPNRCLVTRVYDCSLQSRGHGFLTAVIVAAGRRPSCEAVRSALGVRSVRPAPVDMVNQVTAYGAELIAPLLLPDSVPVLADQRLMERLDDDDVVYTTTGEGGAALGIRAGDLFSLAGARPVSLPSENPVGRTPSLVPLVRR